jgi:hypothetical protein
MQFKNAELMQIFDRVVQVSGQQTTRSYTVNQHFDPTHAEDSLFYVFLEHGLLEPEDKGKPEEGGWQCSMDNPPQVLEVRQQSIWGIEIHVTDHITGKEIMNCYYSPDTQWDRKKKQDVPRYFHPRKSLLKPQDVLRAITFDAEFISKMEADAYKANWDDEEFWEMQHMPDPYGCPSDYE